MIWGVDLGLRQIAVFSQETQRIIQTPKRTRQYELSVLHWEFSEMLGEDDVVFVEEPPYVNNRRTFMGLAQTCGAILAAIPGDGYLVEVATWKKSVVGNGGASKEAVATWLETHRPDYFARADSDQNLVDAAVICTYGQGVREVADDLASAIDLGSGHRTVGVIP